MTKSLEKIARNNAKSVKKPQNATNSAKTAATPQNATKTLKNSEKITEISQNVTKNTRSTKSDESTAGSSPTGNSSSVHAQRRLNPTRLPSFSSLRRESRAFLTALREFLPAVSPLWLGVWGMIYAGILGLGLFFPNSWFLTTIKLCGILLCLVFVLINFRRDYLLLLAFCFTVVADALLARDNLSALGVMIFTFTQLTHFLRLGRSGRLARCYFYAVFLLLAGAMLMSADDRLVVYGAAYACTLICNLGLAFRRVRQKRDFYSLAGLFGFSLFIACDLHVLTSYLAVIGVLPPELKPYADYMAWLFYYPSQLCLSASTTLGPWRKPKNSRRSHKKLAAVKK